MPLPPLLRIPPAEQLNIARAITDYHNAVFSRAAGRWIVVNTDAASVGIAKTRNPTGTEALRRPFFRVRTRRVTVAEVLDAVFPQTLDDAIARGAIPGIEAAE